MNDYLYMIIIVGLTIFMLFFGGHNFQIKVEYDSNYFDNLNTVIIYENKLQKIKNKFNFSKTNFYNINKDLELCPNLLPNFVNSFYIKLSPFTLFNINYLVKPNKMRNYLMILFNHNEYNNLELLINNNNFDLYKNNNYYNYDLNNNIDGYFYNLNKSITITDIFHIYNNSDNNIFITCFIIKKPFWHY